MTQIKISGQGHEVVIDHDGGDLAYVVEKAQKLWDDTKSHEVKSAGFGFLSERRWSYPQGTSVDAS